MATRSMFPYAAVLAAALTLASCSGGDPATAETVPAPTVTTSSSSVPSPSSSAPSTSAAPSEAEDPVLAKIPKEARPQTEEAAEAFVRFFMESLNTAATKADPQVLQGLYDRGCKTCVAMQSRITDLHENGQRYDNPSVVVRDTDSLVFGSQEKVIRVAFDERPIKVVDEAGHTVRSTKAASGAFAATVSFRKNQWLILELQTVGS